MERYLQRKTEGNGTYQRLYEITGLLTTALPLVIHAKFCEAVAK
jgi:hypothetical protein